MDYPRFLHILSITTMLVAFAAFHTGCRSNQAGSPSTGMGNGGFSGGDPVAPVDRASYLQERLGQVQRSMIR